MKLAIITVDYNNHQDTQTLLESAAGLEIKGGETMWLVVDNGSDSPMGDEILGKEKIVWMQTGKNLGFTGGFNRGINYARQWGADYFLLINNDVLFGDKKLVTKMLQIIRYNKSAGVVSPKIYFAPGFEFYKERYSDSDTGKVLWYAGGDYDWLNVASIHRGIDQVDQGKYDRVEKTGFVSGCCMLVSREVFDRVGGFEEKLFAYYEDADWIERVKRAGFDQWYAGNTYIYHKVSRTAGIGSEFTDYLTTRNRLWLGMKYASRRTKFALGREAFRLALTGRPGQKNGVKDSLLGKYGYKKIKQSSNAKYPINLSIIIINYKTTKLTLQLISSIYRQSYKDWEVIVLDNSPDDPCRKAVLEQFPGIKFISNQINNGFSAGNNQMINYSLGKYVLLLNSDIKVEKDSLKNLMKIVDKYGERAIYGGNLYFPTGEKQDCCYFLPTAWRAFLEYFGKIKGSYFMYRPDEKAEVSRVEGAVMAAFLIPKTVINEIGLLQEETFMYFEDIEYCRRAKRAGIPVYFVREAKFIHYHGQASKKAGNDISYQRNVAAAKWYHGHLNYFLVTAVLWAGQKWGKVTAPKARWKEEK